MRNLDIIACLLVSFAVVVPLAVFVDRKVNRKAKPHPLAPVIPLRTGHVRVVEPQRTPRRWGA